MQPYLSEALQRTFSGALAAFAYNSVSRNEYIRKLAQVQWGEKQPPTIADGESRRIRTLHFGTKERLDHLSNAGDSSDGIWLDRTS